MSCLNFCEYGTGPNKKLAKRAAAETMLIKIGYNKSMPQPGKSLLKKRDGKFYKRTSFNFRFKSIKK